jgi:phage tail sheath protein FI
MATYIKPGVYVEESLSLNAPINNAAAASVAAFIGYADRGPTTDPNDPAQNTSTVTGVPTLVTSFDDYLSKFSFGTGGINTWSAVPEYTGAISTATATTTITLSTGINNLTVGSNITSTSATILTKNTFITSVSSSTSFTVNNPVTAVTGTLITIKPNNDLKYAAKTFFESGGSQAYFVRDVNLTAAASFASVTFNDSTATVATSGTLTFDGTTASTTNAITMTSTTTTFASLSAGRTIAFAGIADANYTFLNGKTWVVSSVTGTNTATLFYTPTTSVSTTGSQALSGSITATISKSSTPTLKVQVRDAGAWGNRVWVAASPNAVSGYFDLNVYYAPTSTDTTSISGSNRIDGYTQLSMDPANDRYVETIVNNSPWIKVSDMHSAATGATKNPAPSYIFAKVGNINPVTSTTDGSVSGYYSSAAPGAVQCSGGIEGDSGTIRTNTSVLANLDVITDPLIINWANNSKTSDVNAALNYAATRGDSFVVVDAADDTVTNVLGTTTDVGIQSYNVSPNFGAAYYPRIWVSNPKANNGLPAVSVAPGGAVAGVYSLTDTNRGVFKAPAGNAAVVTSAKSVNTISASDFLAISNGALALNVIRVVPGAGICIMGARTLSSAYSDRYVPVRRTLGFLRNTLKSATQFAVFEPNDTNLWAQVNTVVGDLLNTFWRSGGLAGTTADQAFYIKCDSSINTAQSIAAGELHIEVGVALQRPAEFVIIRIGQISGGTTVTTTA